MFGSFWSCVVLVIGCFASCQVMACTGLKLKAQDGTVVSGRTLEFAVVVDADVAVVPRGYAFVGTTPQGPGISYKAKYAAVGTIAFNNVALLDGLNEKGLAVGTFYFPDYAGYTPINTQNRSKALSPVEFPNWILTQFATIEEVKKALPSVVIAPTVTKEWGSQPAPFHYIVYDKSGQCLVIEPLDGKLVSYETALGVFTNAPKFDWHMDNLRNYLHLTPFNASPITIGGVELRPFGQGSGMFGLPGDMTPPSRFVRAAVFSTTAFPSKTADEAAYQVFHLLNQFDIPKGMAREKLSGELLTDYTQLTCVRDHQALRYYFKTYDDQTIRVVDLKTFNLDDTKIQRAVVTKGRQEVPDFSKQLKAN